jgi:hypothetical protein
MRRIYHKFPPKIDLDFEVDCPLFVVLKFLWDLDGTHDTQKHGEDLVKTSYEIAVADKRTQFLSLDECGTYLNITEAADFRIILHSAILKPEGRTPLSLDTFIVRAEDKGDKTDLAVVKTGGRGEPDAITIKRLIQGACR